MVMTRYYPQNVLVPANTPITAPLSAGVALETNHLERIEIDVPDGHDRATGIRVVSNGTVIVPFALDAWIVANDHYFDIPFNDDITAGDLVVQAYNTDIFDHTFYVRYVVSNAESAATANIVSAAVPGTVAPGAQLAVAGLAAAPGTGVAEQPPDLSATDLAAAGVSLPGGP